MLTKVQKWRDIGTCFNIVGDWGQNLRGSEKGMTRVRRVDIEFLSLLIFYALQKYDVRLH